MKKYSHEIKISRIGEKLEPVVIGQPQEIVNYWKNVISKSAWFDTEREMMITVAVNTRQKIMSYRLASLGTLNETIAHPRDILRHAIAENAYGFFIIHNHPSGEPDPSTSDLDFTVRIRDCAKLMQIQFIDHVIIGSDAEGVNKYYSFKEAGYI